MNSSIEINDANTILKKLVDRTREGKLAWQSSQGGYSSTLKPNLRVEVYDGVAGEDGARLARFDLVEFDAEYEEQFENKFGALTATGTRNPDKEVLSVSVEKNPPYGYGTVEEKTLASLLTDMLALARRSALGVNASMEKALNYLDRIAG